MLQEEIAIQVTTTIFQGVHQHMVIMIMILEIIVVEEHRRQIIIIVIWVDSQI